MYRSVAALAALITLAGAGISTAAPTEKDKKLLADVSAKLLAVAEKPDGFEWPPDIGFEDDPKINAYASFYVKDKKDGKRYPIIRVTEGMMAKAIESDKPDAADRLAFILGHELGHIIKGHLDDKPRDKTPLLRITFGRAAEVEADLHGFELALKAGYSFEKGMKAITRMQELKLDYSSIEGLGAGHPSWNDRAAKADKDKAHLWKAMAAFQNGVLFLTTENYENAITAFERAAREFPDAHEVWANLGYAHLMLYCDKWSKEDFQAQGIGQVVIGGFYTRIDSVKVRAKDKELWFKAVGNLRKSNEKQAGQTIVLANLGLAYLLHPAGKDLPEANKFFAEAVKAAKADAALDPAAHAMLLINLGVAAVADGHTDKGLAQLDEGEKVVRSFAGPAAKRLAPSFDSALLYTRAMVYAGKAGKADKEKAFEMLETYLRVTTSLSLWWDAGYDRYADVAKACGKEAKPKDAFKMDRPEPVRLVTGVTVKGTEITLGGDIDELAKTLGKGQASIAVNGTSMMRVRYEKEGVELLTANDEVIAIILVGPDAPAIALKGKTVGAGGAGALKVGLTPKEVEALLGDDYHPCELTAAGVYYRFYREQGVAVRVAKGKVVELVIVQIPK